MTVSIADFSRCVCRAFQCLRYSSHPRKECAYFYFLVMQKKKKKQSAIRTSSAFFFKFGMIIETCFFFNIKLHSQTSTVYIPTYNKKWFKDSATSCWWRCSTSSAMSWPALLFFLLLIKKKTWTANRRLSPHCHLFQSVSLARKNICHIQPQLMVITQSWMRLLSTLYLSTNNHRNVYSSTLHKHNHLKVTSVC